MYECFKHQGKVFCPESALILSKLLSVDEHANISMSEQSSLKKHLECMDTITLFECKASNKHVMNIYIPYIHIIVVPLWELEERKFFVFFLTDLGSTCLRNNMNLISPGVVKQT